MKALVMGGSLLAAANLAGMSSALAQATDTDAAAPTVTVPETTAADAGADQDTSNAAPYATIPVPAAPEPVNAAAEPQSSRAIAEIVVTARRSKENLQNVPIAISTMSADDLQREQITTPQDLQGRVPSLIVGANSQMRNTETPTIRGQGATYGSSPGVVMYLGEVPLPSDPVANYQGGPGKFFDLASVQILKGSQGTLFGRNTTGGAMLLEPQKPKDGWSGYLRAGALSLAGKGNLTGYNYEGVLNVPIVADSLLARVGGQFYQRDGFTRDVVTGKDYDNRHYWAGRASLLWRPSDGIENYLMGHYASSHDNGTAVVIKQINREGLNQAIPGAIGLGAATQIIPGIDLAQVLNAGCLVLDFFGPSTNCGQDIVDEQAARSNREVQLSADPNDILKSGAVVDKTTFALSDDVSLINIASYSTLRHSYRWDLDGSRAAINEFTNPSDVLEADIHSVTEELHLAGSALDRSLSYVVGAYYEHNEAEGEILATSLMFVHTTQQYEETKSSFAPFAQATYDLGDVFESLSGLKLTLGARHTSDKTSGHASIRQLALNTIPLVNKSYAADIDDAEWTYTAGLDYKLGRNLLYGKVSRGYKTGGIAPISVNPARYTYAPEFVLNYEIGDKSEFEIADMPVRWNSAVYYTDYTNLQKAGIDAYVDPHAVSPVPQLGQSIFNVGSAWVAGLETEFTIEPVRGAAFVATYGYTRAKYREFELEYTGATPQLDCSGQKVQAGNMVDFSCAPFQQTPRHQFSLSARSMLPVNPTAGYVQASVTYAWTDRQYSASTPPDAEPEAWLPSYGLLNASLSWSQIFGSGLSARLYGTNLMNKEYRLSNSNQWNLTYFQASMYAEPRIVGLTLSYAWGDE
ncbi:TonB-dependent receptor [Solimonas terrae]|uniref:TonB-dependent receptor plug domain-containing protein n=1 Tax=Solimonas terrae TaxID=1396819 RepID=A0A6M2BS00_9GAMM|nr:TonB-dependent receptor plug domain-containing protein [Solimonas terrae]NGY04809.1 TonB-dependent receptor plug domain-containing protein [Solimonas terrae]